MRGLTISDASGAGGSVQLLLTPALGWSPAYYFHHFHMAHGAL